VQAFTQSDGSFVARSVESETETSNGQEFEGIVTSVTGSPATSAGVTAQTVSALNPTNAPATGSTVTATITSNTQFTVESSHIAGPFPVFGSSNIGKGQRIAVDSETQSATPSSAPADKIKLQEQAITGTISGLVAGGFVLNPSNTSAFFSLTGVSAISVQTLSSTEVKNVTLANGATVQVRGLLFLNGSSYTMIASRIGP
jgi:beta-xylosidase